jgi:polyisoprenoid-binding protein YceI
MKVNMKLVTTSILTIGLLGATIGASAAEYIIDNKGMHASIKFRVQHLGYSWLYGRFNDFDGKYSYDQDMAEDTKVEVTINTASVDSNHAERDKHLRSDEFLNVEKFPEAKFVSTAYKDNVLKGKLTLNGVTQPVEIAVTKIGEGKDPWGGYRSGFEGTTRFALADFGITKNLGPKSKDVEMILSIEGIKQ